ncbi:ABC-type multidrug transport system ATPase subunit [Streptomyces sp. V1I6]|nr:ABC-type multidrug transport system ATPase subunit [Streptomyces sp. V1I6]
MTAVIETRGLTKRYRGGRPAVDRLDLSVPAGSVFGFLGPNGSGKTTTFRMLMGLIGPTAGSATVLGRPMPRSAGQVLPHVGALIEARRCTGSSAAGTTCCATTRPIRPPIPVPVKRGSRPRWTGLA